MSRRWLTERKNDHYHKRAKEEGYRSRSAYKLKQMDDRFHFFRRARYVLDIGAAPGGWLQVVSEAVGEDGLVVGVDLRPIEYLELGNVETIVGDILDEETMDEIRELLPGSVDVVLSDLSPNISGVWDVDQFRQIDLATMALKVIWMKLREVVPPVDEVRFEPLDVMTLLSLPDHLRKTATVTGSLGKATADEISERTERARAVESGYLNQLVRMGYLKKERDGRMVLFSVIS